MKKTKPGLLIYMDGPLRLVLNAPTPSNSEVLLVPIVPFIDPIRDDACIIEEQELKILKSRSCLEYKRKIVLPADRLEALLQKEPERIRGTIDDDLLKRAIEGGRIKLGGKFNRFFSS